MYENHFPNTDNRLIGASLISNDAQARIEVNYPGFGKGYTFPGKDIRAGIGTGRVGMYEGRVIVQILLEFSPYAYGWVYIDEYKLITQKTTYSRESVQQLLNEIVYYNNKTLTNNLLSARIITSLESKGIAVPHYIKEQIKDTQRNIIYRDERLRENEYLTGRHTGTPIGASAYKADLQRIMDAQIGEPVTISITTLIVLSAIATLLIVSMLYMAFIGTRKEALSDYKASEKYLATLADLDPEAKKIVESEMSNALKYGYKIGSKSIVKSLGMLTVGVGLILVAKPLYNLLKQ